MNYADFTRELPTLRMKRAQKVPATVPVVRETLVLGCTTCGSKWHGRIACPMAVDEEKDGKP